MADDKPGFTAKQTAHARKIEAERAIMDAAGVTRSQLREGLQEHFKQVEARRAAPAQVQVNGTPPKKKPPLSIETALQRLGFQAQGQGAGGQGAPVPPMSTLTFLVGVRQEDDSYVTEKVTGYIQNREPLE